MESDFRIGEWLVQPQLNLISRGDEVVSIQPKVMDLLLYLAKHSGEVLAKERIIQAVWPDTFVTDDVLKYSIFELRKAFQDDPKLPRIIQTIPRRGYRLVATVAELSPEPKPAVGRTRTKYLVGAVAIVAAVVMGLWLRDFLWPPGPPIRKGELRMAVLPFENLNADPDNDYFSNGLAIDIINQLAKIGELTVISWTSSMDYKAGQRTLPEIIEELDVSYLLEGSVRREEDQLRVTTQLIDVPADLTVLWSETYDRQLSDLFEIQTDIAQKIAAALRLELTSDERARIKTRPTGNLTAYDFYLRGREYHNRPNMRTNNLSIKLFNRALELDPNFALAYAGLAEAYLLGVLYWGFPDSQLDTAVVAARRAILIEPDRSEGYAALGLVLPYRGRVQEGLQVGERAVQLNPNYDRALRNLGYVYMMVGRFDDAFAMFQRALAVSPLHGMNYRALIALYNWSGEYEKAEFWCRRALEIEPDDYSTHERLARCYRLMGRFSEAKTVSQQLLRLLSSDDPVGFATAGSVALWAGDYEKAEKHLEKAVHQGRSDPLSQISLAFILQKKGDRTGADKLLNPVEDAFSDKLAAGSEFSPLYADLAMIHSIRGEKQKACDWLQKAIDSGWRRYDEALKSPLFENLHDEPRFQQMMAGVKTKVDEMRRRIEVMEKEWDE